MVGCIVVVGERDGRPDEVGFDDMLGATLGRPDEVGLGDTLGRPDEVGSDDGVACVFNSACMIGVDQLVDSLVDSLVDPLLDDFDDFLDLDDLLFSTVSRESADAVDTQLPSQERDRLGLPAWS